MAIDESFIAASDPNGSTTSSPRVSPKPVVSLVVSFRGGYGAIERSPQNEETPVLLGKTGVFIVQDSRGSYYLVGDEGLESHGPNTVKTATKPNGPISVVSSVVSIQPISADLVARIMRNQPATSG